MRNRLEAFGAVVVAAASWVAIAAATFGPPLMVGYFVGLDRGDRERDELEDRAALARLEASSARTEVELLRTALLKAWADRDADRRAATERPDPADGLDRIKPPGVPER